MNPLSAVETEALLLSLRVAFWCVTLSLPVGILVAWLLARKEFPGRALLDGLVHFPLVVPPVAVGFGLLVLFGRQGPIGAWLHDTFDITIAFTWKGAALASAIMAFPLLVRAIRLSLEAVDERLEAAARTLGAGPVRVLLTVTLPLTAPGIVTGTVLAFARSLGEFGATITFVSNIPGQTSTLPLALYSAIQTPDGEPVAVRLALIAVAVAVAALILSDRLGRAVQRRLR